MCHSCDTRSCVNPDHLFLGTKADNTKDMMEKGRHKSHVGEECHNAKLTDEQVRAIRDEYQPWVVSQRSLAAEYGVSKNVIQRIVENSGWTHVQ